MIIVIIAIIGALILFWAIAQTRQPDSAPTVKSAAQNDAGIRATLPSLPTGIVRQVLDGDTLLISQSFSDKKVRLDSIDCPEDGQPWGDIATYGLIKLVGGKSVSLEEHGIDPYGRTLATIWIRRRDNNEWMNINERMVTLGHAWVMRAYYDHLPADRQTKLNQLEAWAKSKKVGLWRASNPVPPWRWRKDRSIS